MIGIIVITGSRQGVPRADLIDALDAGHAHLVAKSVTDVMLYHGDCRGVDVAAKSEARIRWWIPVGFEVSPGDWARLGKRAGPERNGRMLRAAISTGFPVVVVALPRGEAGGTTDCINQARGFGLDVLVFEEGA